jgi:hypothetical protein
MSCVTNAIFSYSIMEYDLAREQDLHLATAQAFTKGFDDAFSRSECWRQYWLRLDDNYDAYGGSKAMETQVFAAAFNYFPHEDFLSAVASIPWAYPEHVQLIAMGQEDDRWHIYHLPGLVPPREEYPIGGCICCPA